ncbi:MAG: hypothetical protein CV087_07185 [Candidatus Brocadia sp. WS118]|nr:MAG: hypothetical protein CV087_07185 [Candidatus Brocadia sp. WS118]
MPKLNDTDLSELEREFELEMEEEPTEELELEEDLDTEFEEEPEGEFEEVEGESTGDYAERLYELSQREFESEMELDDVINEPLRQMEEEFFLGGLKKRWKQFKKRGLGRLLQKGLKFVAGKIPALQALKSATSAARAALKGDIGGLVKSGLGAALKAHPAGAALSPALSALGFEAGEDNREAWDNVVNVAREAYDRLAGSLHENADDPLEASRLATDAFQSAVKKVSAQKPYIASTGKRRIIHIRRGETIVIKVV